MATFRDLVLIPIAQNESKFSLVFLSVDLAEKKTSLIHVEPKRPNNREQPEQACSTKQESLVVKCDTKTLIYSDTVTYV